MSGILVYHIPEEGFQCCTTLIPCSDWRRPITLKPVQKSSHGALGHHWKRYLFRAHMHMGFNIVYKMNECIPVWAYSVCTCSGFLDKVFLKKAFQFSGEVFISVHFRCCLVPIVQRIEYGMSLQTLFLQYRNRLPLSASDSILYPWLFYAPWRLRDMEDNNRRRCSYLSFFFKECTHAVCLRSCNRGPLPFPIYEIPAHLSNVRKYLPITLRLQRSPIDEVNNGLSSAFMFGYGNLFLYPIYCLKTTSRAEFIGARRWHPFLVLYRVMTCLSKSMSPLFMLSASLILMPVLCRTRIKAGIAIRQLEVWRSFIIILSQALKIARISLLVKMYGTVELWCFLGSLGM